MSDIRKRVGKKGTTYQVRYPSTKTKSGYAYATFDTMKEARYFLESGKASKLANATHHNITTVEQAVQRWLDICEKEGRQGKDPVTPAVLDNYRRRARVMTEYDWEKPLQEIQAPDIVQFRSWLLQNCSRDQAKSTLSSFHSALLEMQTQGVIIADPASGISIHESRYKEPVAIPTVPEISSILSTCDRLANSSNNEISRAWQRYRPMIYLAVESGMRPQEYLAVPASAFSDEGVRVIQAVDSSNKIGPPKSRAGRRFIPLGSDPLELVRHYIERHGHQGLAFPARNGAHQQYRNYLRRGWHRLMEESGLMVPDAGGDEKPKYTPYALRHFFASMLIDQNENLKFIQTVMGHKSIEMTFDVYGHIIKEKESRQAKGYSGIIGAVHAN